MGRATIDRELEPRTAALLQDALVWDNHACMPLRPDDESFLPQLERYRRAGVDVVSLNVGFDAVPARNTMRMLAHFRHWIRSRPDDYALIRTVADIDAARAANRLAVAFDIEGGCALGEQPNLVELYYELGVRWMLIAYNRNNALGGGCQDEDTGLTPLGRRVVAEMNRVGMAVCCSHTGLRTTMDVMECSSSPVIFSHSNPLGVWQHPRNICDEAIRACAATDGVVGINGIGPFLGANDARTETIVRHVDYVAQLVGAAHVGLGLDYVFDTRELEEYLRSNPHFFPASAGYAGKQKQVQPEQIPEIAGALLKLGYSDADTRGVLGENHRRIAQRVWK